jgi:hypothetical protein
MRETRNSRLVKKKLAGQKNWIAITRTNQRPPKLALVKKRQRGEAGCVGRRDGFCCFLKLVMVFSPNNSVPLSRIFVMAQPFP